MYAYKYIYYSNTWKLMLLYIFDTIYVANITRASL